MKKNEVAIFHLKRAITAIYVDSDPTVRESLEDIIRACARLMGLDTSVKKRSS